MINFRTLYTCLMLITATSSWGITTNGKIYLGLVYDKENSTSNDTFKVSVTSSRIYFSDNYMGTTKEGVYFLYEGDMNDNLSNKHSFLGYRTNKVDSRMGKIDSLLYHWIGSYSNEWNYGGNIAIVPQYNRFLTNSGRVKVQLGDQFEAGVNVGLNGSQDYNYFDVGGKWSNDKLTIASVYQFNHNNSTTAFENRDTWASAIAFKAIHALTLVANYAHYSDSYATNSYDDAFSIGAQNEQTTLFYQTSQNKDQARINLMHLIPLNDATRIGFEIQAPMHSKYYNDGASTKTKDSSFAALYLGYNF